MRVSATAMTMTLSQSSSHISVSHQSCSDPKKARQVHVSVKKMLISFFDVDGLVHRDFAPPGHTANQ